MIRLINKLIYANLVVSYINLSNISEMIDEVFFNSRHNFGKL